MAEQFRFCPLCGKDLVKRTIEQQERLACGDSQCGFVLWDNPVPVVAAIVEHDEKVILARNKIQYILFLALLDSLLSITSQSDSHVLGGTEGRICKTAYSTMSVGPGRCIMAS